jgi:DNA-binding LacI/PurR family transcriptional regulator
VARPAKSQKTIVDIAKAAGVSVSTVSRILNNRPDVAAETRQRVMQVIEEQRFAPQAPWQQLRSGRSRVVALHFPQDFNPPSQDIITGAALRCASDSYSLNLMANTLTEPDLLAVYRSGQADGMILMEILTHDWRVELLRKHELPFVLIGRCGDNTGLSYVDIDIASGVADAIRHLFDLGHRQIGFITIAPILQRREYGYATWALKAYQQTCQQLGLPGQWQAVDLKSNHVHDVVLEFLSANRKITAIVTPQETGVPGILRAIRSLGLRIPLDISVIGLLNDSIAELITPPLTSIGFPAREMGREAASILITQLEGRLHTAQQALLPAPLRVRGSTGPARVAPLPPNS